MPLTRTHLEQAIVAHGPMLRRTLHFLTGGRQQDADDLLQRTFERAWARRHEFVGEAVAPWLMGIARLEYLMYLRSQHRWDRLRAAAELELTAELEAGSDEATWAPSRHEEHLALLRCLERLEPLDRRIVNLYYGRETADGSPAPTSGASGPVAAPGRSAPVALPGRSAQAGAPGGSGPVASSPDAGVPHTDPEVAAILSRELAKPWAPDRVRKRRYRALEQLSLCLERE